MLDQWHRFARCVFISCFSSVHVPLCVSDCMFVHCRKCPYKMWYLGIRSVPALHHSLSATRWHTRRKIVPPVREPTSLPANRDPALVTIFIYSYICLTSCLSVCSQQRQRAGSPVCLLTSLKRLFSDIILTNNGLWFGIKSNVLLFLTTHDHLDLVLLCEAEMMCN